MSCRFRPVHYSGIDEILNPPFTAGSQFGTQTFCESYLVWNFGFASLLAYAGLCNATYDKEFRSFLVIMSRRTNSEDGGS